MTIPYIELNREYNGDVQGLIIELEHEDVVLDGNLYVYMSPDQLKETLERLLKELIRSI
jgi:hypothetical protein